MDGNVSNWPGYYLSVSWWLDFQIWQSLLVSELWVYLCTHFILPHKGGNRTKGCFLGFVFSVLVIFFLSISNLPPISYDSIIFLCLNVIFYLVQKALADNPKLSIVGIIQKADCTYIHWWLTSVFNDLWSFLCHTPRIFFFKNNYSPGEECPGIFVKKLPFFL